MPDAGEPSNRSWLPAEDELPRLPRIPTEFPGEQRVETPETVETAETIAVAARPSPSGASPSVASPGVDGLAEVRWHEPDAAALTPAAARPRQLSAEAVGRSAWDQDLRSIGTHEPEGWQNLDWQDLDAGAGAEQPGQARAVPEPPLAIQLLREWGPVVIAAIAIAMFTRLFLVQAYHIPSLSMAPTLDDGDRVVVNRLSYQFGDVQRGEVVVFGKPLNQPSNADDLIKRVVGLSGETIEIRGGAVYVDGLLVEEPYLNQVDSTRPLAPNGIPGCAQLEAASDRCTIPDGFVFVMGDNRSNSQDSRKFGPIPEDTIVGRAFVRVWPVRDFGGL